MFPRRPSESFESCAFTSLQSNCRQQNFCPERPGATPPLTSSSLTFTPHPYMHGFSMNSLTPLPTSTSLSHPYHAPHPLPHPGYVSHLNEHTVHHTAGHVAAHAHPSLNGYSDGFRQDYLPEYGLGRSDYSKPLTITTFHNGFPGNSPPYPYH